MTQCCQFERPAAGGGNSFQKVQGFEVIPSQRRPQEPSSGTLARWLLDGDKEVAEDVFSKVSQEKPDVLNFIAREPHIVAAWIMKSFDEAGIRSIMAILNAQMPGLPRLQETAYAAQGDEGAAPEMQPSSETDAGQGCAGQATAESESLDKLAGSNAGLACDDQTKAENEFVDSLAVDPWSSVVQETDASIESRSPVKNNADAHGAPPVIQFSSSVFYCTEDEGAMVLDVLRMGDATGKSSVTYHTFDGSAKAGEKYDAASGTVMFFPDEIFKQIRVNLRNNDLWDATLEFGVKLEDVQGAALGRYLHTCQVMLADDDVFPTNKFKHLLKARRFNEIPNVPLFIEYCKMILQQGQVRTGIIYVICLGLFDNFSIVFFLFMKLVLVDLLTEKSEDQDWGEAKNAKFQTLVIVAIPLLLLAVIKSILERCVVERRLKGRCTAFLQLNTLRKFLNYEEHIRMMVRESDVILTIARDCPNLTEKVFLKTFSIIKEITLLLFLLAFQFIAAFAVKDRDIYSACIALTPVLVYPFFMALVYLFRHARTSLANTEYEMSMNKVARGIEAIIANFRLIAAFQGKAKMISGAEKQLGELNAARYNRDVIDVYNRCLGPMLMSLMTLVFIIVAGRTVLANTMTVGTFLTSLDAYLQTTQAWNLIYLQLLTVQTALPALEGVVCYMNMPIELHRRMKWNRERRTTAHKERLEAIAAVKSGNSDVRSEAEYFTDVIPLHLTDVGFLYEHDTGAEEQDLERSMHELPGQKHGVKRKSSWFVLNEETIASPQMGPWSFVINQGDMIALVGSHGSGKSTLLRILGGVLLPQSGVFFSPSHLRMVFVTQEPLFFHDTLWENLTYGLSAEDRQAETEKRVWSICQQLGVPQRLKTVIFNRTLADWRLMLSLTERVQLHIARALIANPEVLVLDKPTIAFDDYIATRVLKTFKKSLLEKGLDMFDDAATIRRPRTCIFTACTAQGCQEADQIFCVSQDSIKPMEKDQVNAEMLR